jgi:hypothetical protein
MHRSLMPAPYHKDGGVFGWTYEQLGWNMVEGGFVPEKKWAACYRGPDGAGRRVGKVDLDAMSVL